MFLKSMDIFGFKSFAEKTSVVFEKGITVIVGPNGCGKSNIVDSIKWVLGEKQAKNIRGDKMEDIIFSGTESRKPLSLAEVAITIDNTNRILSLDSDEVTVTRRVFRDGESEYLINKSPVRLKDIEQLFMDTGIGKSSYSVMEQGKIDLILSTRAEDRRYIFEEAAGISKFKFQKKESLKKLEETGYNLERINDIIKEIEREKELKARQAEKTKIYLTLLSELKENDVKVNILKFNDLAKKRKKSEEDIEVQKKEREALSAKVSLVSADNEKDEKQKNDIQLQIFELEKKLHTYRIKVEDIDVRTDKNRRLIEEQQSRRADIQKNIVERTESMNRLKDERKKSEESGIDIRKRILEDRKKLQDIFEMRKRKIQSIHNSRDKIEDHRKKIKDNDESLKKLRGSLELVIKKLVDAIDKRKAELAGSEEERQRTRAKIDIGLKELDGAVQEALRQIDLGLAGEAKQALAGISVEDLKKDIMIFESFEDGFRSILFDKTGIHAQKEELDKKIHDTMVSTDNLNAEITMLEKHISDEQSELEEVNTMIMRIEKDLARNENENAWIEKHLKSLEMQIADIGKQIQNYGEEILRSEKTSEYLSREIADWENRLVEFNERSEALKKEITEFVHKREEIEKQILSRKDVSRKDAESLKRVSDKISDQEKLQLELIFKINGIEEYLWTEYEKKMSEFKGVSVSETELSALQKNMQELKKKIQDLGPVNNLAIEEFKDLKKRFEYYISQRKDIEKAREDILSVIQDINKTSVEMFISTFMEIQKNFSEIFKQLFEGGNASLELTEHENVLESGIEIFVRPPGKKLKSINLLSGGERALTAIALLFATYMARPSPFCFLDEIDAPLDEENIGRFTRMLQQFARSTQFMIVSHNKKTMSIGESIYGITMSEPGVSSVVSIRMEKMEKKAAV